MPKIYRLAITFFAIIATMWPNRAASRDEMRYRRYTTQEGLSHRIISGLMQDSVGYIWLSTWDGLCRFDGEQFTTFNQTADGEKVGRLGLVRFTRSGRVWTIRQSDRQEYLLNEATGLLEPIAPDSVKPRRITRVDANNGPDSLGLRLWHDSMTYYVPYIGAGLTTNTHYTAIADRQGIIWANFDDALCQVSFGQPAYEHIDCIDPRHVPDVRYGDEIRAMLHLRDGGYLLGCKNGCIYCYDDDWQFVGYLTPQGTLSRQRTSFGARIYAISQSDDGTVWLGSRGHGLFALSGIGIDREKSRVAAGKAPRVVRYASPTLRNDNIFDLVMADGHRLLVATWDGGVQAFDIAADGTARLAASADPQIGKVRRISVLNPTLYALCSTQGIFFVDDSLRTVSQLGTMDMSDLCQGLDGTFYAATLSDGVYTFRLPNHPSADDFAQAALRKLDVPEVDNIIMSAVRLPDDCLCFVSDDALTRYYPNTGQVLRIDRSVIGSDVTFGEARPLLSAGRLLLGTTIGRMQVQITPADGYTPNLVLNVADTVRLTWGNVVPEVRAVAIDFRLPRLVQYAWRECPDSVWHVLGDVGRLPLGRLWPGTYCYEVRSTDARGIWADNSRSVTVVVGLAVWQPLAAVGLLLLLVVIALILSRRMNGPVRIVERAPVIGGIQPSQPIVEARDQQFIDNVTRLVEENIDDVQFDIDRMATSMNVSRSVLYSKFKTLLNTTPGNFITEIRLKRAIQLLNTRQYQVQEVARMCGWDSRRYFARSFRQKMGMSPSQYLEQLGK